MEKTFVRYLERKIARILKLLLIPWKLFFSQTNRNATAGKWKLASTEPTQRYMFYFGRQEHPVFSVLMLWMVKQKEKQLKRYFPKKEYIILTCWERSEFKPRRLRKEKQLRLRSGSHCWENWFMLKFFPQVFLFCGNGKHFVFPVWHIKLILCSSLSRFSPPELIRYPVQSSPFLTLN